jgi:hypothetical protein
MATARPLAYNTGPQISGTEQVGDLSIGFPSSGFTNTPQYWNGPDEDLGYVIGIPVPSNTQPTPLSGVTASLGFFRSPLKTQVSFVEFTNSLFGQNFTGGTEAKQWLNTNGYWTSYAEYIVSADKTDTGGYTVGGVITKDMQIGNFNYNGLGTPNGQSVSLTASNWSDWNGDIFDSWGYFYLYDPTSNNYLGLQFNTVNLPDGVFDTQVFNFNGRTFTITQGYPVQGIFKFEIRVNDNLPFRFGEAGNMGSDGSTVNIDQSYNYTLEGTNLTLWYNENYQSNNIIERFYSYYIPFNINQNATKTYVDYIEGSDNLYLYSVECNNGITVYHSKQNDVKQWVVYDLKFGN